MTERGAALHLSARMKRVRRTRTDLEEVVAAALRALGVRYRRNVRSLPGSPDFANQRRGWAMFVNGCFWHGHRACRLATVPKSNTRFWTEKLAANRRRDASKIRELRRLRFRVTLIWQCQISGEDFATRVASATGGSSRRECQGHGTRRMAR